MAYLGNCKVGDKIVREDKRTQIVTTCPITKVGRKWITVGPGRPVKVNIETGAEDRDVGFLSDGVYYPNLESLKRAREKRAIGDSAWSAVRTLTRRTLDHATLEQLRRLESTIEDIHKQP